MSKALTKDWFNRVWNDCDEKAIADLMWEDCVVDGLDSSAQKRHGFVLAYNFFKGGLKDIKIDPFEMVEENGKVLGHARLKAVHIATGKDIDMIFSFYALWRDGKIAAARNVIDYSSLLTQVGTLDKSAIAQVFQP